MGKKLIAVFTAIAIFLGNTSVVFADIDYNKDKLQKLEQKVSKLEDEIFSLNSDIAIVKQELKSNEKEIKEIESQLYSANEEIKKSERILDDKQDLYDSKMRQLYKENGQISYLSLLLEADSLADLISKASLVSQLLKFDNKIINDYMVVKDNLLQLREELSNKKLRSEELKKDNEKKLKQLEEKRDSQDKLVKEINSDMKKLTILIENERKQEEAQSKPSMDNEVIIDASESTESTEGKDHEEVPEGSKPPEASPDKEDGTLESLGVFKLTGYCNCVQCCGSHAGGTTATGTIPKANHTIAVDPTVIPYRTKVIIMGEDYVAEDCGGGVKKYHIDIYFATHKEAISFGTKYAEVFIKK